MSCEHRSLRLGAPAKVNLFLEIERRRDDGFHDLDTVFCEVDWGDTIALTTAAPGTLELKCDAPDLPRGPGNLAWDACARLLKIAPSRGLTIELEKRLPRGGGLGGGSSNAASALLGANDLLALGLDSDELAAHALALGSDVPFFLDGGCQRGRGRGERLTAHPARPLSLVLVCPKVHCSTARVFGALELPDDHAPRSPEALIEALGRHDLRGIAAALFNRLELPVFELWPGLARQRDALLEAGCLAAVLSGSGASLFGLASGPRHASDIASQFAHARVVTTRPRGLEASAPAQRKTRPEP